MAITPVQSNSETRTTTYRDAKTPIKTQNLVHPLPAEGHLVHDSLLSVPKFWMKDFAYDMKALKDGLSGKANDHQTGRLNDVGLKLGGIGIATYLATQTADPKKRLMEYIGLGAFLASMQLYPLLAINAPSRIVQGFDIGKEYIDDQGRKKSVLQDGNYVPFDLYRGEYTGEDLDIIGDRMGIPRSIKNRDELTKEQMRKIAIQNNTLWMLGAGFATPVMTALICCGFEQILSPAMAIARNKIYNSQITNLLKQTKEMTLNTADIDSNSLNKKVEKLLGDYKEKELPKEKYNELIKVLTNKKDENLAAGIREDVEKLLKSAKNAFVIDEKSKDEILKSIKESSNGRNTNAFNQVFDLSKSEIDELFKKAGSDGKYITEEQFGNFKNELNKVFSTKIDRASGDKNWLRTVQDEVAENVVKTIKKHPSYYLSEAGFSDISDFAKVLGDFQVKERALDKCKSFKVENSPETVLARSYKKFENAIFSGLGIKYSDLKQMKESEAITKEILENKIQALVKDEEKYQKTIKKLAKIMSETEIMLHGESESESYLKDLISAIENVYNNTAKRINNIGEGKFSKTINKLIKEDVNNPLENTIKLRKEMFEIQDGINPALKVDSPDYGVRAMKIAEEESKGVGSSKQIAINRIIERIQGVENSQRRLLHTLDYFKREVPVDEYGKQINKTVRNALLEATSRDHTLKLYTENNPEYYKDIMGNGWNSSIQNSTKEVLKAAGGKEKGDIYERFMKYLERFYDVIGSNDIDYLKPEHNVGVNTYDKYDISSQTRQRKFDLVAQNPVDFFKKASKTRFENQKWLRTASAIGASVLAVTVLSQFCFGKIKNPHNIQRQVNDDKNS